MIGLLLPYKAYLALQVCTEMYYLEMACPHNILKINYFHKVTDCRCAHLSCPPERIQKRTRLQLHVKGSYVVAEETAGAPQDGYLRMYPLSIRSSLLFIGNVYPSRRRYRSSEIPIICSYIWSETIMPLRDFCSRIRA